jgi:hypothetical protein
MVWGSGEIAAELAISNGASKQRFESGRGDIFFDGVTDYSGCCPTCGESGFSIPPHNYLKR